MLYVLFKARARKDGRRSIYCRITLDSVRASEFFTGVSCLPSEWDQPKQQVRRNQPANETLRQIAQDVHAVLNRMLYAGKNPTAKELRETYLNNGQERKITLTEAAEKVLQEVSKNREMAPLTKKKYKSSIKKLLAYLEQSKQLSLPAVEAGRRFAEKYTTYLRDEVGNNRNTIAKEMEILRAVVREHQVHPLEGFTYKRSKVAPPEFLTQEQVEKIYRHRFSSVRLQQVADLFLFQVETGLAVGDLARFDYDQHTKRVGEQLYLYMRRQKEPLEAAVVPLSARAMALLEKYAYVLPQISLQKYNAYLKEVGEIVGIGQKLTTHLARKTAGHIWLSSGMSYEQVAFRLGHSKIETTRQYYARLRLVS